jgi:NAD(P)H-flavin reductase
LLSIAAFVVGILEPVFNPFPPIIRDEGQLGSYPGIEGNVGFIFHFYGGIGYIATATFQFFSPVRRTFPKVHHILGYAFFFFQLIALLGNLIFLFGRTNYLKGGVSSFFAAVFFFNPWWILNSVLSVKAVRKGNIMKHHIYMIRTIAVSIGNFTVPPFETLIRVVSPSVQLQMAYSAGFWASYMIAIILGELCIHYVYPTPKVMPVISQGSTGVYGELASWTELKLIRKEQHGNYYRFIFEAPINVFIPPAYHITMRHPKNSNTFRPYTPISCNGKEIEFFIKKYEKGVMSSFLASLNVGDRVESCGPFGSYEIQEHSKVLMIAGGTGITPMMSILRYSLETLRLRTKFHLVFYNKELILESQLAALRQQFEGQFEYDFVKDSNAYNLNPVLQNHSSGKQKQTYTGSNATVLLCGPRAFCDAMIMKAKSSGISKAEIFAFGYSDR